MIKIIIKLNIFLKLNNYNLIINIINNRYIITIKLKNIYKIFILS